MPANWNDVLLAYLHDPPDKALGIQGHVDRACRYAGAALDEPVQSSQLKNPSDAIASVAERFPAPHWRALKVDPGRGELTINHPLSGQPRQLPVGAIDEDWVGRQIRSIVEGLGDDQRRFLALWRFLPNRLADAAHPWLANLPADTRTPDHTIWHHLDITTGLQAAGDTHGRAFLAFALGPVQRFIEAARSVRDLWSGSMILSWLAFRAMRPILKELGPTALIYPAMRGIPLVDLWLHEAQRLGDKVPLPDTELRRTPSLPHRFLALVPWGTDGTAAKSVAAKCRDAAAAAWQELAAQVKQRVEGQMRALCPDWGKRWDSQIAAYFSTATAVAPLMRGSGEEVDKRLATLLTGQASFADAEAFGDAEAVRKLARSIPKGDRPGYAQDHAGRWQYQVELVGRSLAAARSIRHVPGNEPAPGERFPQKCTLLGSFEQMGPDDFNGSNGFWKAITDAQSGLNINGVRVRSGEALCAVALVKRFAAPALLEQELGLSANELRFADTWTVAAAEWLANAEKRGHRLGPGHIPSWNGHWLHWSRPDQDLSDADTCPVRVLAQIHDARKPEECGTPPVYYAILKLDGDDLGGWLRGAKSPQVRKVMHPDLVRYYEALGPATRAGLDAKRPVGPALHAAISAALANFALRVVPDIVRRHHGLTIYSGGDDTLVILPVSQALACALELHDSYMSDWHTDKAGREYPMMGRRATLSGGIVVAHAKDDLRLALQDARRAEKQAKEAGRNALVIAIRRRSGEHTSASCPWDFAPIVENWTQQFRNRASDRWAYHLYGERATLEQLPPEAIQAEIRRQIKRAEKPTPQLIPPERVAAAFESYRQSSVRTDTGSRPRFDTTGAALSGFLTLCHTASFLARGRDR